MLRYFTILCCAFFIFLAKAAEYTQDQFIEDWSAPLYQSQARRVLIYGSALTSLLVLTRDQTVEPLQDKISSEKPLGSLAPFGDIMGQLVPNIGYMTYQYYAKENARRAGYMFKVTALSGLTTFFSKRIINQRRPNGGDRNSFPSGHTTTAFAFAGVVGIEHPDWAIPAYALAGLVGFSRINDNAHYLHDVFMGATIGLSFAYAHSPKMIAFPLTQGGGIMCATSF